MIRSLTPRTRSPWADGLSRRAALFGAGSLLFLQACSRERPLPGERLDIRAPFGGAPDAPDRAESIALPPQQINRDWSHRQGLNGARPSHPALSAELRLLWQVPIGQGHERRRRLATDPIVADGRIFTLDSGARVQATALSGAVLWAIDIAPPHERSPTASGGGLAFGAGRLFVTSAYAFLAALDPDNGRELWRVRLAAPVFSPPAVQGNRVFCTAADGTLWALDVATGRIDWTLGGIDSLTTLSRGPAPAIAGELVLFASNAGVLTAVRRSNSAVVWQSAVAGRRPGAAYATISAVSGDPVIDGAVVYAANHQGRVVALSLSDGAIHWTAREAAVAPVWPVGGSVFFISDENRLIRLAASDGRRIWATKLPLYQPTRRERDRTAIYPQFGPTLAGSRLWVAGAEGRLRAFDPTSGAQSLELALPSSAASLPVVAEGRLFVLLGDGTLAAFG